jgi:hypothetical protein
MWQKGPLARVASERRAAIRPLNTGRNFAQEGGMATRKALDRRPGPLPDIQTDDDSVSFTFDLLDLDARLVVRCDGHGDVYIRIPETQHLPPYPFTPGD